MKQVLTLLLLTTSAFAAPIGSCILTLNSVNGQAADGFYVSPYYATLGSQSLVVYCDDVLDSVSVGESWPVNEYAGTDTTGALFSATDYSILFWLVSQSTSENYVDTQIAMWTLTDPDFSGATISSNLLLTNAISNTGTVDLSEWDVLTPIGGTGQEFIVDALAETPEPASTVFVGIGLMLLGVSYGKKKR